MTRPGTVPQNSQQIDRGQLGYGNKALRVLWSLAYYLLFRPSPVFLHGWRRFLLRCFGAKVGHGAHPYPRCRIWAPWNLTMGAHSCLANDVDCYCVAPIVLGEHSIVSQYAYLCSATHDYTDPAFPLIARPIRVGAHAWVAAGALVGPGVTVGEGAVIGAGSVTFHDVPAWAVVAGNPARKIKDRVLTAPRRGR